jgi:tRNA threonylcarbamoyladenosine biosynthesis protein TsaB
MFHKFLRYFYLSLFSNETFFIYLRTKIEIMSLILTIETSTKVCSVALHDKGNLLAESTLCTEKAHAEMLTLLISQMLTNAKIEGKNLRAVAISQGPGSYTGLRIGSSVAKGLCFAWDLPLIALPTLESMAWGFRQATNLKNCLFAPMIDARRMEVFAAVYDEKRTIIQNVDAIIVDEKSFLNLLEKHKIAFFGDGAAKCEAIMTHPNAYFAPTYLHTAAHAGTLAYMYALEEKFVDYAYFEPFYLKEYIAAKGKSLI